MKNPERCVVYGEDQKEKDQESWDSLGAREMSQVGGPTPAIHISSSLTARPWSFASIHSSSMALQNEQIRDKALGGSLVH